MSEEQSEYSFFSISTDIFGYGSFAVSYFVMYTIYFLLYRKISLYQKLTIIVEL